MSKIITKEILLAYFKQSTYAAKIPANHSSLTQAAVLVPFIENNGQLEILLTQRSAHLTHHAGQISFPGGKMEIADDNIITTALRETQEEIGIAADKINVLGQLSPLLSITQFFVTPVIALIKSPFTLRLDSHEVASTFWVPAEYLFNPNHQQYETIFSNGKLRKIYVIQYQNYRIWGLTAQIIITLGKALSDLCA